MFLSPITHNRDMSNQHQAIVNLPMAEVLIGERFQYGVNLYVKEKEVHRDGTAARYLLRRMSGETFTMLMRDDEMVKIIHLFED